MIVITTRSQIEHAWSLRGFSCDLWVDPPGQVWNDYVHGSDEILRLLDGQLEIEMHGHVSLMAQGEELLIPANVRHTVRNVGGTTACWLYGYKK